MCFLQGSWSPQVKILVFLGQSGGSGLFLSMSRPLGLSVQVVFVEGRQIIFLLKHKAFVTWRVFHMLFTNVPRRGEFFSNSVYAIGF